MGGHEHWVVHNLSRLALHGEDEELQITSEVYSGVSHSANPGMIFVSIKTRRKRLSLYLTRQQAMELARHLVDRLAEAAELSGVR